MSTSPAKTAKLLRMRARSARTRAESVQLHIRAAYLEAKVFNAGAVLEPEDVGATEARGSSNVPTWFKRLKHNLTCEICGKQPATWYTQRLKRPRLFAFLRRSGADTHAEDVLKWHLKHSRVLCRPCLLVARSTK